MLLLVKSETLIPNVKDALVRLGLEHTVARNGGNDIAFEISVDSSALAPQRIAQELSAFGAIYHQRSRTPLLDALPDDFAVEVSAPGGVKVMFGGNHPSVLIAGPCALEEPERLELTAAYLRTMGARVLRGGAVKPRTSPHDFQGVGRAGFRWLAEAAHRHGMACVSEALSEDDVPEALEYLDLIQVGARNMQNFSLLRKLGQGRRPVLLKRSPGSTLREWALAAEHLLSQGNNRVIFCERGVRGLERELRYTLDLAGAAWMQERFRLPMVIDPSHATGSKQIIPRCARAAVAMGFSGVMLEVHPEPSAALSDALQALSFEEAAPLKQLFQQ